jgi:putative NADH-flavin reductase
MKITVFGGSGKTGQVLIETALKRGYQVVAVVRNPQKIAMSDASLEVRKIQIDDRHAVESAVAESEAVISVLGPVDKNDSSRPISRGVSTIIEAMKKTGVRRYIQVATPSSVDVRDGFSLSIKLQRLLIRVVANFAYQDIIIYGDLVRNSGLDWTLVRVPWLKDGEARSVKAGYVGEGVVGATLTRASMVTFMLDALEQGSYIGEAPSISN